MAGLRFLTEYFSAKDIESFHFQFDRKRVIKWGIYRMYIIYLDRDYDL